MTRVYTTRKVVVGTSKGKPIIRERQVFRDEEKYREILKKEASSKGEGRLTAISGLQQKASRALDKVSAGQELSSSEKADLEAYKDVTKSTQDKETISQVLNPRQQQTKSEYAQQILNKALYPMGVPQPNIRTGQLTPEQIKNIEGVVQSRKVVTGAISQQTQQGTIYTPTVPTPTPPPSQLQKLSAKFNEAEKYAASRTTEKILPVYEKVSGLYNPQVDPYFDPRVNPVVETASGYSPKYQRFGDVPEITHLTGFQLEQYGKGAYEGVRSQPLKTAIYFGIGLATPPIAAASKLALLKVVTPNLATPSIAAIPKVIPVVEKGIAYGGSLIYGTSTAVRAATSPEGFSYTLGRLTATELAPAFAGGLLGSRLTGGLQYKIKLKEQIQKLPEEQRLKFQQYLKEIKTLQKYQPKIRNINLKQVERLKQNDAYKAVEKIIAKDNRVVVGGSVSQRSQLYVTSRQPNDLDLYHPTPSSLKRKLIDSLVRKGVKNITTTKEAIYIDGVKAIEVHPLSKISINIKSVTPTLSSYKSGIVQTPSGTKILKLSVQAQRKLIGGYIEGQGDRAKDIKDINAIIKSLKQTEAIQTKIVVKKKENIVNLLKIGKKGQVLSGEFPPQTSPRVPPQRIPQKVSLQPSIKPKGELVYKSSYSYPYGVTTETKYIPAVLAAIPKVSPYPIKEELRYNPFIPTSKYPEVLIGKEPIVPIPVTPYPKPKDGGGYISPPNAPYPENPPIITLNPPVETPYITPTPPTRYNPPIPTFKFTPPPPPPKEDEKLVISNILRKIKKSKKRKLYQILLKRRGKYKAVGTPLPYGRALQKGVKITKESIAATFKLKPTQRYSDVSDIQFRVPPEFRTYQVRGGRQIPLDLTFIQRRGTRLGTRPEVISLQSSRKMKGGFRL